MAVLTYPCVYGEKSQDPNYKCKNIRKSPKLLRRHIRREHLKHLYCSQCFKRFGNKFERDRHTKLERACERSRAKPEAPVPQYVIELASKFNACKFQDWNNLLFKNGKPIYDYQDPQNCAETHDSTGNMSIISSPETGRTSEYDHPNEPSLSTVGHQHMNLNYGHSIVNGHAELARPNGISIASTGASLVEYPVHSTAEAASFYDPDSSLEDCPEEPSTSDDDVDDYDNEVDGEFESDTEPTIEATGFPESPASGGDVCELDCTTSTTETMDFCDFDPSLGKYADLTPEDAGFSDFDLSPGDNSEKPVPDDVNMWNDFDDLPEAPIDSAVVEPSPENNVTEQASVVPYSMDMDRWDGPVEQKPLVDTDIPMDTSLDNIYNNTYHGHGLRTEIFTVPVRSSEGLPYSDNAFYSEDNSDNIGQFHNDTNAGVSPKDLIRNYW